MTMYGGYKVIRFPGGSVCNPGSLLMTSEDVDTLREALNKCFAKEENYVSRFKRQLYIPDGELMSNWVGSDGGGQCVDIYAEIREIQLPGIPKDL